jgi:molecular chaperone DnaK (HSP70)
MVIHPSGGLNPADVNRMAAEARVRDSEERAQKEKRAVVRQLEGLVANTVRSVQGLEGKLSRGEQQRILDAIETAKRVKGRPDASVDELKRALTDMEKAAGIIGQAMLRP